MKRQQRNYIIATTPRTGSSLLCEGLQVTGLAGIPQEYAVPEDVTVWHDFHGCANHLEYFLRFPDLCRTANGVFGAKLMWVQFVAWGQNARRYLHSEKSTPDIICSMVGLCLLCGSFAAIYFAKPCRGFVLAKREFGRSDGMTCGA